MAILRKKKRQVSRISPKSRSVKKSGVKTRTPVLGTQEIAIERTKFYTPAVEARPSRRPTEDLPSGYGENKIVLQTRDPWWIHAYWEVASPTMDKLRAQLREAFLSAKMVLRVYDVSYIIFDGTNAHRFFDIEINPPANNWYIDTAGPGRSWCVDIGLRLATGKFIKIARSNTVYTPIEGPSWITDEEWMIPEDMFARLYGLGFGLGKSSPVGKAWQERIKKALFSGILGSRVGITSVKAKK